MKKSGSTLSAGLLSKDVALVEIIAAFALLVGLQFLITFTMTRWPRMEGIVKTEPRIVFRHGQYLERAMRVERLTRREIDAAIRAANAADSDKVAAVILETDGSLSVVLGSTATEVLPAQE